MNKEIDLQSSFNAFHNNREIMQKLNYQISEINNQIQQILQSTSTWTHILNTLWFNDNTHKKQLEKKLEFTVRNYNEATIQYRTFNTILPPLYRFNLEELRLFENQATTVLSQITSIKTKILDIQWLIAQKKSALLIWWASEVGDLLIKKWSSKTETISWTAVEILSTLLSWNALQTQEIQQKIKQLETDYNELSNTLRTLWTSLIPLKSSKIPNLAFIEYADLIVSFLSFKKDYTSVLSLLAQGITTYSLHSFEKQLLTTESFLRSLSQQIETHTRMIDTVLRWHQERKHQLS